MVRVEDPHELKIIHKPCKTDLEFHRLEKQGYEWYICPKCKRTWYKDFITRDDDNELLIFRTWQWNQLTRENRRRGHHK